MDPACPLHDTLQGAKPRACLAVRFGRAYQGGLEREPLLRCQVCSATVLAPCGEPSAVTSVTSSSIHSSRLKS